MSSFDQQILENLLQHARSLAPTLQASMEQTFVNQSHYRWEGLRPIQSTITTLCQQINEQTRQLAMLMLHHSDLFRHVDNPQEFTKNMQILNRDLTEYSQRLTEIHSKHQNAAGVVRGGGQVASFIGIWESYVEWTQSYCDVVIPVFGTLYEDVLKAQERYSHQQPAI